MADQQPLGRFVWYELMTTDPAGAEAFYPSITGWTTSPFPGMAEPYTIWMRGEAGIGGLMRLPDDARKAGAPPHWMAYVGTHDVDATAEHARQLGAKTVVPPTDIPNVGRFAVISDPQGAHLAIYKPGTSEDAPRDRAPEIGDISWHELATTDAKAALQFYGALFGWEHIGAHDMGEMGVYHMFGWGGRAVGGMFTAPPSFPAPPHWLIYFRVADINRGAEAVKAKGGKVLMGPHEVPGGDWIVQCMDPQGAAFALHAIKAG
jgi:hypothetical protein